ncbi:Fusaric acid resistance protein-like-domain-containing protein [Amylocystis lapponica]|nr:Fusaric acid resistance protein-like-domain-containing protein [Amylocystis lapponica]
MDNDDRLRTPRTPSTLRTRPDGNRSAIGISDSYSTRRSAPLYGTQPSSEGVQSPVSDPQPRSSFELAPADEEDLSSEISVQDESEESDSHTEVPVSASPQVSKRSSFPKLPTLPTVWRNVLKCSLAYFLGSLFTFSPYLSGFISDLTNYGPGEGIPSPSGHMVATVAVYYNPAKTLGGMVEADIFCTMGLLFAAFVSLSSMSMFWFFEVQPGWEWLADVLVLLWIGLGMSGVAWMKVWMGKPTFNTACSMTSIILFIVVVKEGGVQTLLTISFIVLVGATISNVVCVLLWPQRATNNLKDTMTKTLQSFATLLGMLTETFLLEEPFHHLSHEKLKRAVESHQASFTSLKKSLVEAQSERMFGGPSRGDGQGRLHARAGSGEAYEDAIDSLTRLGQHLNGLRSGTTLQFELIKAQRDGRLVLKNRSRKKQSHSVNGKNRVSEDVSKTGAEDDEETAMLQAAADTFGELVDDLGPPLRALTTTCTTSLKRVREAFSQPRRERPENLIEETEFQKLADDIERALFTFDSTSNHAVLRLYRANTTSGLQSRDSHSSMLSDNPMLINTDGENIFLVYFFIFTLQEFARELVSLVDAVGRICSIERANAARRGFWNRFGRLVQIGRTSPREKRPGGGMRKRLSAYFVPEVTRKPVFFPKIRPHAPNTIQTPARENLTFIGRIKQSLWALGARLKEQDLKYAFKTGMATAMLAAPAFFDSTRPMFVEYRGEWALISFFVVMGPTIGATNYMGVLRVLGTLSGAATAVVVWSAFPENPYVLSVFGFFYSIPCFYYIITKPQYATTSRFVLLTYNLTCLYCYNVRQKDISVVEVAFHRALAVTIGVVWAWLVSRFWWPTEARRALSRALGDFCLNMGWLYTRLVAFNSFSEQQMADAGPDLSSEISALLPGTSAQLTNSIQEFMAMELHLQIKLIELQGLLAQTQHEPRLKGPFPVALYRSILTSLQTILDKLHSMRCVTSRHEWHTTVRKDFIMPVNKERREMVGNIILYFSTLASAFRLKSPLPPYLPPAEESRQRLVDAIRKLDVVRNRDVKGSRQLLFFAYALTMKGVIHELDYLGRTLQDAFGVIGQSTEEFDALFRDTARSHDVV